jgi:hypothetical protein
MAISAQHLNPFTQRKPGEASPTPQSAPAEEPNPNAEETADPQAEPADDQTGNGAQPGNEKHNSTTGGDGPIKEAQRHPPRGAKTPGQGQEEEGAPPR